MKEDDTTSVAQIYSTRQQAEFDQMLLEGSGILSLTIAYIILSTIGIIVLIFAVWHACSRRFELPCPAWLRWMVELDNPFAKTCRAQTIIEPLGLEPGMSVLDADCGPGRLAMNEIYGALKPGGLLSVTETIFDPHFQSRGTVSRLAGEAGLVPTESFGTRMSFTMPFQKPIPEKERHAHSHRCA